MGETVRRAAFAVLWLGGLAFVLLQASSAPVGGSALLFLYAMAFAPALALFAFRAARGEKASFEGPLLALALVWAVLDSSSAAASLARIESDERAARCFDLQCRVRQAIADESAPAAVRHALLEYFAVSRSTPHSCPLRAELGRACEASPECRLRIADGRLVCAGHGRPRPLRGRGILEVTPRCEAPEAVPAALR